MQCVLAPVAHQPFHEEAVISMPSFLATLNTVPESASCEPLYQTELQLDCLLSWMVQQAVSHSKLDSVEHATSKSKHRSTQMVY